jgi:phosphopantothenoylcysteine decarboxylase/phosphopantothenate--cysteine ligase
MKGATIKKPKFVVTAGPTREYLDPVRFLSNPSTGKMGFAVAAAAARRGCETVLVAGPVSLRTPAGVKRIDVVSAREMLAAVLSAVEGEDAVLVSTAAVADWRPARCAASKLKKREMLGVLRLVRNPDILKTVKGVRKIGFAAETGPAEKEAARKCREKKLEFVVANDVTQSGAGFGCDTNRVTFVYPDGRVREFPLMSKRAVAGRIVDEVLRA